MMRMRRAALPKKDPSSRGLPRRQAPLLLLLPVLLALALLCWQPLSAKAAGKEAQLTRQYEQARAYYQDLVQNGSGKTRDHWLTCVTAFRSIFKAAEDGETAPKSLFMLGRVYEEMYSRTGNPLDLSEAMAHYEDLATLFPRHRLADDALLALGSLHASGKDDPDQAGKIYAKLIAIYPDGDMVAEAGRRLQQLKTGADEERGAAALANPGGDKATVLPIRHWSNRRYTRVVVETSAPVSFKHQLLPSNGEKVPGRLYIDLKNSRLSPGMERSIPVGDGLLRQVRNAQYDPDTVRVVLDTQTTITEYKVFNLSEPSRVVIDVMSDAAQETEKDGGEGELTLVRQLGLGVKRIVIDPGHGGKDPGTISPSGMKEKNIVLDVALRVATRLREKEGYEVILTRDRDIFVPLEERTAIANASEADLFLSIHVNAAPTKAARGIETYVLDLATNKDAMRVAALENATSARQVNDLQSILLDLMYNSKINESLKLAELVQDEMITGLNRQYRAVNNLGVKKAPFVVLIGAQMPSILTEIAFLSNPEEEERLRSDKYLASVADHISSGIGQYVQSMNLAGNYQSR